MNFKLTQKDCKKERYEADLGHGITAVVEMYYHTFLKYWHVDYRWGYNDHYRTDSIDGVSDLHSRKEARRYAEKYMTRASFDDLKRLDKFNQDNVIKSMKLI